MCATTDISYNDECFGYRSIMGGVCSVLRDSTAGAYRELGFCNTMECPFYKPRTIAYTSARIGDRFVPYTREQIRIAKSYQKPTHGFIRF